jgi:hypothetical protein
MAEGEGGSALGLLSAPFGGTFPSSTGGHAGPSNAQSDVGNNVTFGNAFNVAGQGGSANSSPVSGVSNNYLLIGAVAVIVYLVMRKK